MSRIGKKPIEIPKGVKVDVAGRRVTVEGPKGTLSFEHRPEVDVTTEGDLVHFHVDEAIQGDRKVRALWGTTRALVSNMVEGVTKGYEKKLQIVGVGWNAQVADATLKLQVGLANTIEMPIPQGLDVKVERDIVTVSGADKQIVGEFCASARARRKPEPYNGKGVRYADEVIKKKQGKQFGK